MRAGMFPSHSALAEGGATALLRASALLFLTVGMQEKMKREHFLFIIAQVAGQRLGTSPVFRNFLKNRV